MRITGKTVYRCDYDQCGLEEEVPSKLLKWLTVRLMWREGEVMRSTWYRDFCSRECLANWSAK